MRKINMDEWKKKKTNKITYELNSSFCGNKLFIGSYRNKIFKFYTGKTDYLIIEDDIYSNVWRDITHSLKGEEIIKYIKERELKNV